MTALMAEQNASIRLSLSSIWSTLISTMKAIHYCGQNYDNSQNMGLHSPLGFLGTFVDGGAVSIKYVFLLNSEDDSL